MVNISGTKLCKAVTRELLLVLIAGVLIPTFCREMLFTLRKIYFIIYGGTVRATPNGPACCWWLLAVLPIDPRYQLSVLSMTSLKERLVKIQQILTYLQSIPNN